MQKAFDLQVVGPAIDYWFWSNDERRFSHGTQSSLTKRVGYHGNASTWLRPVSTGLGCRACQESGNIFEGNALPFNEKGFAIESGDSLTSEP
jgi:hypothetical protein